MTVYTLYSRASIIKALLLLSRLVLGLVFMASGVLKLISPDTATEFVRIGLSIEVEGGKIIVVLTSLFEISLGATFLLLGGRVRLAALLSGSIMLIFTSIGVAEIGSGQSCGCFGGLFESKTDEFFLARNLALLMISMYLVRHHPESPHTP